MVLIAWSTPLTATANAALTAAQWNASVRDNLNQTAVAKASGDNQVFVSTGATSLAARTPDIASLNVTYETTTSTTYTSSLTTPGPSLTVTTGTAAMVWISCLCRCGSVGVAAHCSYAVTSATTITASDEWCCYHMASTADYSARIGTASMQNLTAGSNIFSMGFKSGTAGTSGFGARAIMVFPL